MTSKNVLSTYIKILDIHQHLPPFYKKKHVCIVLLHSSTLFIFYIYSLSANWTNQYPM